MPPGGVSVARNVAGDRKRPAAGVNARPTMPLNGAMKPGTGGNGNNGGVKTPPYARGMETMRPSRTRVSPKTPDRAAYMRPLPMAETFMVSRNVCAGL